MEAQPAAQNKYINTFNSKVNPDVASVFLPPPTHLSRVVSVRRAHLKECFETLKKNIPNIEEKKTSNLSVLRSALRYIQVSRRFLLFAYFFFFF